jgi:ubiquinol-cytochrome c reductase cytochrome b subunit
MLGYMGAMPAEGIYLVLARVGTIYYFFTFYCCIASSRLT